MHSTIAVGLAVLLWIAERAPSEEERIAPGHDAKLLGRRNQIPHGDHLCMVQSC